MSDSDRPQGNNVEAEKIKSQVQMHKKDTIFIGRKRPRESQVKFKCDDTHKSSANLLGCGGLLRDSSGVCLVSYTHKVETCDVLHGWYMDLGIDLAMRQNYTPSKWQWLIGANQYGNTKMYN
jgi:hypothetical protein